MILGGGALAVAGVHGAALALAQATGLLKEGWTGFNVLHFSAARMGGLMLGYAMEGGIKVMAAAKPKLIFALGADDVDYSAFTDGKSVVQGKSVSRTCDSR